ncbi:MAG: hypothetical protein V3S64_05930, partial [bacterium]
GMDADTRIAVGSNGEPAIDPAVEMPPKGDSPPEALKPALIPDARAPLPAPVEAVRYPAPESGSGPQTRAAGHAPRRYDVKIPAVKIPPDGTD